MKRFFVLGGIGAGVFGMAVACGSGSEKKAGRAQFEPGDGGQSGGGVPGQSSAGSTQTAGSSQLGGNEGGSMGDAGGTDPGDAGSSGQGDAGSPGQGDAGASSGLGGADNGSAGHAAEGGQAGTGGEGGSASIDLECGDALLSVGPNLLNGSFEVPALATPTFLIITPGNEPAGFGWTAVIATDIARVNWNSADGVVTGPAKAGIQYLDVVSTGSEGHIQQTVDTTPGQSYELALSYAKNAVTFPVLPEAEALVRARVCDHLIFSETIKHSTSQIGDFDWKDFRRTFVSPAPFVTIEIIQVVGGGHGGMWLDAISLAVPPG